MTDDIRQKYERLSLSIPIDADKKQVMRGLLLIAAGLECTDRTGKPSASALITMLGGLAADNPAMARRIVEALAPIFDIDVQQPIF